jgi:hypothetical protein
LAADGRSGHFHLIPQSFAVQTFSPSSGHKNAPLAAITR